MLKKRFLAIIACLHAIAIVGLALIFPGNAGANDWPMLGRDRTRNAVSPEKNPPLEWDVTTGRNIKWRAALGSYSFSSPVVANGMVWIGTNKYHPSDAKYAGVLMCVRESDGKFLFQHISPQQIGLPGFWAQFGMSSSPLVEKDRMWFTTTLAEILCLDIGPLQQGSGVPQELWKLDEKRDLGIHPAERGFMDGGMFCSIGASHGELIYVITANGTDMDFKVREPHAPALVCLNKNTGNLVWQDSSPSREVLLGERGNPLVIEVNGRAQVVAPQGDGWLRSFDALTGELIWKFDINPKNERHPSRDRGEETHLTFVNQTDGDVQISSIGREAYSFSLKTRERREQPTYAGHVWLARDGRRKRLGVWEVKEGGGEATIVNPPAGTKEPPFDSEDLPKNYFLSAPVLYEGKLYIGSGQGVEEGEGPGRLCCIDPGKRGDISLELDVRSGRAAPNPNSGAGWHFDDIGRMHAAVAIRNGLVIAAGFSGIVYCLDAKTGTLHWKHDTQSRIRTSPLIIDDKVFVGDEDGVIHIFGLAKEKLVFAAIEMDGPNYSSPVFANGVLYLATGEYLYAIQEGYTTPPPPKEATGAKP